MPEGSKEIFDQENQTGDRDPGTNYSNAFKEFVKPGVGEVDSVNQISDQEKIKKARAQIRVGSKDGHKYSSVSKAEGILADQHNIDDAEGRPVRMRRPERHNSSSRIKRVGAIALSGLVGFFGILGLHREEKRLEQQDKENAAKAKVINDKVEFEKSSRKAQEGLKNTTKYESEGEEYEIEN